MPDLITHVGYDSRVKNADIHLHEFVAAVVTICAIVKQAHTSQEHRTRLVALPFVPLWLLPMGCRYDRASTSTWAREPY